MSKNLSKILMVGFLSIILTASAVLVFNYINNRDSSDNIPYTQEEKEDIYNAINSGNPALYQEYLKDGAKMSFAFDDGTTPLEILIESSDVLNAQVLLKNGFDLSKVNNNHMDTISNIIVYNKNFDIGSGNLIIKELISQVKNEIDSEDKDGFSLLMNAIYANNYNIVSEIIKYTDDINKVYNNETPLTFACQEGIDNLLIIKELIDKGADINYKGGNGDNCLMNAISSNQNNVVEYLVSLADLDVNAQNDDGQTALHYCVEYSNIDAIDIILQNRNINKLIEDNDGFTPKELASSYEMEDYEQKLK